MSERKPGWEVENAIAARHGFIAVPDQVRGNGWCKFSKGDVHVWFCSIGWARAVLVDNYFTGHRWYVLFEDALAGNDDPATYKARNP